MRRINREGVEVEMTADEEAALLEAQQALASHEEKLVALKRIAEIRLELTEKLADNLAGTPAEKAQALAAIGTLRAELAIQKAKL